MITNKLKKYLLIYGIIGIIYASINYFSIWFYALILFLNIILMLPVLFVGLISLIFPRNLLTSSDLGQYWNFLDWFMVVF